jgi:enamine deaminase RidA (YjgF/YER057c/UK114 family)
MRKWLPGHKPLLTAVGVKVLAFENMKVEIEVAAETKSAA